MIKRILVVGVLLIIIAAGGLVAWAYSGFNILGLRALEVSDEFLQPTMARGDLAITYEVSLEDVEVGNIIRVDNYPYHSRARLLWVEKKDVWGGETEIMVSEYQHRSGGDFWGISEYDLEDDDVIISRVVLYMPQMGHLVIQARDLFD